LVSDWSSDVCSSDLNIGTDRGGFEYTLHQSGLVNRPNIIASSVLWGNPIDGTARELLASVETSYGNSEDCDDGSALDEAKDFLRDFLADGPKPSKEIKKEAHGLILSERTLRRAKEALGIEVSKLGYQGKFVWKLPEVETARNPPKVAKFLNDGHSESMDAFGNLGHLWRHTASAAKVTENIVNCKENENYATENDAVLKVKT